MVLTKEIEMSLFSMPNYNYLIAQCLFLGVRDCSSLSLSESFFPTGMYNYLAW